MVWIFFSTGASYQCCTSPLISAPPLVLPLFPVLYQESHTEPFLGSLSLLPQPSIYQEIKFHDEVIMVISLEISHVITVNTLHPLYYLCYVLLVNMWYIEFVDVPCYGHLLPINHHVSNIGIIGINNKPFFILGLTTNFCKLTARF